MLKRIEVEEFGYLVKAQILHVTIGNQGHAGVVRPNVKQGNNQDTFSVMPATYSINNGQIVSRSMYFGLHIAYHSY